MWQKESHYQEDNECDQKEQQPNQSRDIQNFYLHIMVSDSRITVSVTRGWAGRGNAALPEPTSSHANCSKTRRLPPVGCTLCWADFSKASQLLPRSLRER